MSENELCRLDFTPDPDLGPLLSQEQTHAMFGHDEEIRQHMLQLYGPSQPSPPPPFPAPLNPFSTLSTSHAPCPGIYTLGLQLPT